MGLHQAYRQDLGDEGEERLETITLLSVLGEELETPESWQPVRRRFLQGVSIRPAPAASQGERVLAHPDESLQVRQTVLPLGVPIEHFGHFKLGDFKTFRLRLATGEQLLTTRGHGGFLCSRRVLRVEPGPAHDPEVLRKL